MIYTQSISMSIDLDKLPPHTPTQFGEWINFVTCNDDTELSVKNPLYECDLHDYIIKGSLKLIDRDLK
jgi:hypothetical protein